VALGLLDPERERGSRPTDPCIIMNPLEHSLRHYGIAQLFKAILLSTGGSPGPEKGSLWVSQTHWEVSKFPSPMNFRKT
jgi:hypothetical protein